MLTDLLARSFSTDFRKYLRECLFGYSSNPCLRPVTRLVTHLTFRGDRMILALQQSNNNEIAASLNHPLGVVIIFCFYKTTFDKMSVSNQLAKMVRIQHTNVSNI